MSPIAIYLSIRLLAMMGGTPSLILMPFIGGFTTLYLILFVDTLAGVNRASSVIPRTWVQMHGASGLARRMAMSCRDLRCEVGNLYFIDSPLTLNVLKYFIDTVIFLLVNY